MGYTCLTCKGDHEPGAACPGRPTTARDELAMKCPLTLKQTAEAYGMKLSSCIADPTHWKGLLFMDTDLRYQWADAMLCEREPDEVLTSQEVETITQEDMAESVTLLAQKMAFKLANKFSIIDDFSPNPNTQLVVGGSTGEGYLLLIDTIKEVLNSEATV